MNEQQHIDALIHAALGKHLHGDLDAAESAYREIVASFPAEPKVRHYLGFLLQQQDRLADALEQMNIAIALDDRHAEWHFNLGIVLSRLGHVARSIAAFSAAIEINPDGYFYWTNLGASFERNGEAMRAEQCYLAAASIDPGCPDAHYLLAALYLKQERYADARRCNALGVVAAPVQSVIVRGQAYHDLGRMDEAIELFENRLAEYPGDPVASHLLAAYRANGAPDRCSREYVERTFDAFAPSFDDILGRIKYCAPQLAADYLSGLNISAGSLDVLDLGCGTGLVGERLRRYARAMSGVDLSCAMLDVAAGKKLYDRLYRSDIAEFLSQSREKFDLVSCMDTFIYLGKLDDLVVQIYDRLKAGGHFVFSTEKLADFAPCGFRLNISGRYSHHRDYLSRLLNDAGFAVEQRFDIDIRMESGSPVAGEFICARRTA